MRKDDGPFYFGCWKDIGHYYFYKEGAKVIHSDEPFGSFADGGFLGKGTQTEGLAHLSHISFFWTILSFWDRSVDHRGSSHSNFIFKGFLSYDEILKKSKEEFPDIFKRFNFEIKPAKEEDK